MYQSAASSEEKSSILDDWDASNLLQKFAFSVPNRMLAVGMDRELTFDDLTGQPRTDYSTPMIKILKQRWAVSTNFWFMPRLIVSLLTSQPLTFFWIFVATLIEGAVKVVNPVLLLKFLQTLADPLAPASDKYYWASAIAGGAVVFTINHHILFFYTMRAGWNWRSVAQALVFDKLLDLDSSGLEKTTKGNLVNLISNDVGKFEAFAVFQMFFIVSPMELLAVLYILSQQLDFVAALCGLALCLLFLPLQVYMGGLFAGLRTRTAANTDARIRHISESIEGIATVKSYGWETPFFALIRRLRAAEQETISSSQQLKAITKALDYCIVPSCNLVMQWVFWMRGGKLTLPVAFSCLLFLQCMRTSIFVHWAQSVEQGSEAIASSHRLEAFLNLPTPQKLREIAAELDRAAAEGARSVQEVGIEMTVVKAEAENLGPGEALEGESIPLVASALPVKQSQSTSISGANGVKEESSPLFRLNNVSFCYGTSATKNVLSRLNLEMPRNELLIVIGAVGAGKTSFLGALLGELNVRSDDTGDIRPAGNFFCGEKERPRVAYCAQIPWIFSASVKQNVTFSSNNLSHRSVVDEPLYDLAMKSCCILEDLKQLPNGHDTDIGEKGVSISGGQKARLGLARAVYSDADVYLLDDPLSAVDTNVSRALFDDCILGALKARGKSVILCTHQMQYLKYADKVLVINEDGSQQYFGSYKALEKSQSQSHLLSQLEEEATRMRQDSIDSNPRDRSRSRGQSVSELLAADSVDGCDGISRSSGKEKDTQDDKDSKPAVEIISVIEKEQKGTGDINTAVYLQWLRAGGLVRGIFSFTLIAMGQIMLMVHEYWLRWWVENKFSLTDSQYLWIMGVMTPVVFIMGFFRVKHFFDFSIVCSSQLHQQSLWAILHSPLSFFTANPSGRILNRFSKDQSEMDERLPYVTFDCTNCMCVCLSASILICISMPVLLAAFPPLIWLFLILRRKYMNSMREIKRLEAATRSPIYAGFSATLDGLSTLRAYKLQDKMRRVLTDYLDENGRAWWSYLMAARWFGFRMDCLAILVLVLTSYFAAFYSDKVDQGLLGFALVYSMNLTGLFQWTVRLSTEVETMMTAVERIAQYANLPEEEGYEANLSSVLEALNSGNASGKPMAAVCADAGKGGLEIRDLTVKYRDDLPSVLNGLQMSIPAGSKCGIVGRTGSGKSTVLSALLRLNIVDKASSIILDSGKDLLKVSLEETRSLLTIIPQQPHLFLGTLRFNLDPFSQYSDDEVWNALSDASVADFVKGNDLGLLLRVEEAGNNLSVGQKQLLSLARAILRRSRIILMDEVTASVDYETDATIQRTIRTAPSLRDATIITVAHRLQTIADADRIFVINAGKLLEEGSPTELLQAQGSYFAGLVRKSGEQKEITKQALDHEKERQEARGKEIQKGNK